MQEKPPEAKVNIKKLEHLKDGVSPIIACVGTPEDFKYDGKINWLLSGKEINYADNVDYNGKFDELKKNGFENDGTSSSYVISPVDCADKYSRDFHDCTGVVVTGIEKGTGENISFLSHQDPFYFLKDNGRNFSRDLDKQIQKIKEMCEDKTIDVVIFGGRYSKVRDFKESDPDRDIFIQEYEKSINFLSKQIKNSLGFEPLVIVGPKTEPGGDMVFYDNDTKKLYLVRDKTKKDNPDNIYDFSAAGNFKPSELGERKKDWKPGEWGLPE